MNVKRSRSVARTAVPLVGWIDVAARRSPSPPPAPSTPREGVIDAGIAHVVKRLQEHGIDTCQSCEGGAGHAYPEPTVDFLGTESAGWKALAICADFGFPVLHLSRVWNVDANCAVYEVHWRLVFRHLAHRRWEQTR